MATHTPHHTKMQGIKNNVIGEGAHVYIPILQKYVNANGHLSSLSLAFPLFSVPSPFSVIRL